MKTLLALSLCLLAGSAHAFEIDDFFDRLDSKIDNLFNPRLTLFLDAQYGSQIYFFAQSRLDRGFDPSDRGAQVRLDEYALRITPWDDGRFALQIGKFATVIGNWVPRHLSWENP